jgi:anti-sigma regulatory factor (Ser/Thr protein kinase)
VRFAAKIDQLHPMILWVRTQLSGVSLDNSTRKKIELVLEEAVVNIIQHAYPGKEGEVELQIQTHASAIRIVLKDRGPPFDPLSVEAKIDPDMPLELRELGGLGIPMIRKFVDEIDYMRENGYNVLTLVKKIY